MRAGTQYQHRGTGEVLTLHREGHSWWLENASGQVSGFRSVSRGRMKQVLEQFFTPYEKGG